MVKYFLKRLIFAVFALFILLTVVFFLMSLLPISPLNKQPHWTPEFYRQELERLGLNKPILVRYGEYWSNLFQGNLGLIYNKEGTTIPNEIFPRIPNTLYIAGFAYIIAIFLGFTFGITSAIYRGKWQDTLINILSVIFISVPSFVVGIVLLRLAGFLNLPLKFMNFGDTGWNLGTFIASSIMPILSLTFGLASALTYYVRNEVVDILSQDYIKTARSKGLGTIDIIFKHVIRNAMIPALSIMGPSLLTVISGSIVLEQMFGVAGIANILVNAIQTNEVNIIMFQALFLSGIYFLIVILLDIIYTVVDPRIKLSQQNEISFFNFINSDLIRGSWKRKWLHLQNRPYEYIEFNSSLHNYLKEHDLIDYKKKTVKLDDLCYEKFNLKRDAKTFVLGKDILSLAKGGTVNERQ